VGHDHAHTCWWGERGCRGGHHLTRSYMVVGPTREWVWRGGITTLAAAGGGPGPGGGEESPRSQLLVVGPAREGMWWRTTKSLGACTLVTVSCPPRFSSFVVLELYVTARTATLHHSEPKVGISGRDSLLWICLLFSSTRHLTLVLRRTTRTPVDHLRHPYSRVAAVLQAVGR